MGPVDPAGVLQHILSRVRAMSAYSLGRVLHATGDCLTPLPERRVRRGPVMQCLELEQNLLPWPVQAAQTGQDESATPQEVAQRIDITLHRENARII